MSFLFNIFNEIIINTNNYNNCHINNNNDNNNININNNIAIYLKKNCSLKSYKKLFKKKRKKIKQISNNNNNKTIYSNLNMFLLDNNDKSYFCDTCKISFANNKLHNFIMNNKCPNISKMNQSFVIETICDIEYKTQRIVKPNLDIEFRKLENDNNDEKCLYITNYLLVKCPICLTFKPNCIIQKCGHCLCRECLNYFIKTTHFKDFKCWICRQDNNNDNILFTL